MKTGVTCFFFQVKGAFHSPSSRTLQTDFTILIQHILGVDQLLICDFGAWVIKLCFTCGERVPLLRSTIIFCRVPDCTRENTFAFLFLLQLWLGQRSQIIEKRQNDNKHQNWRSHLGSSLRLWPSCPCPSLWVRVLANTCISAPYLLRTSLALVLCLERPSCSWFPQAFWAILSNNSFCFTKMESWKKSQIKNLNLLLFSSQVKFIVFQFCSWKTVCPWTGRIAVMFSCFVGTSVFFCCEDTWEKFSFSRYQRLVSQTKCPSRHRTKRCTCGKWDVLGQKCNQFGDFLPRSGK